MDYRVRKAVVLAEECLHKGWSAAKLAEQLNLSPSRLHQLFKEETGVPPARYLRQLRLRRARELLETTNLSVKQVMAGVGIADESHFVRDFKKSYGLTPARYRERFLRRGGTDAFAPAGANVLPRAFPSSAGTPAPPSSVPHAPPLLLRRASHPRQLSEVSRAARRSELLSLLRRRHAAFAELTSAATERIARGMPSGRTISYSARRGVVSRRFPPSAGRPQEKRPKDCRNGHLAGAGRVR